VLIGLILAGTAIWLAYETKSLLIGESARKKVVDRIRRIAEGQEGICGVNEILTMHMGPEFILVNISVEFVDVATADDIEAIVAGLDRKIKEDFPKVKKVFVEAEPMGRGGGQRGSGEDER
jgi:divalent metal cation (Fe/Co/Zn/Cd) transporter